MRNVKQLILAAGASGALVILGLSGCKMMHEGGGESEGGRTAGRVLDDHTLTSGVKERLENAPVYKFGGVDVKTFDGVVQLSGFVQTQEQKQHAGEIAQQVEGVSKVINNITVQPLPNLDPTGRPNQTDSSNQSGQSSQSQQ